MRRMPDGLEQYDYIALLERYYHVVTKDVGKFNTSNKFISPYLYDFSVH